MVSLDKAPLGVKVKVVDILGGKGIIQRLNELGIFPGTCVTVLQSGILRGPLLVSVGGRNVALSRGVAKKIIVEVYK